MPKENKRCLYITNESMDIIKGVLEKIKKKTISSAINCIINEYSKIRRFIIKDNENYKTVKISIRKELLPLLAEIENKSGVEAVCDLISYRLADEFYMQIGTSQFPDGLQGVKKRLNDKVCRVYEEFEKEFFKR